MLYLAYAALCALADLLPGFAYLRRVQSAPPGGAHPPFVRYLIGTASGLVIGAALFELLPEGRLETNAPFVALGFFAFYLIEKVLMLHACQEEECDSELHRLSWLAAVGMATDNVVDGVGITAATLTDPFLGGVVALAVVAHEVPQGISTVVLARQSGFTARRVAGLLLWAGLLYPAGALTGLLLPRAAFIPALALVGGVFLYVGASDLLAEAHRRFNWKVVLSVLAGALLMFGLTRVG